MWHRHECCQSVGAGARPRYQNGCARCLAPNRASGEALLLHHGTAHHVESVVANYRRARRLHERKTAEEQNQDRSLSFLYDEDGSLVIKGRFPSEQGAIIRKALELAMDRAGDCPRIGDSPHTDSEAEVTAESAPSQAWMSPNWGQSPLNTLNIGRKSRVIPHRCAVHYGPGTWVAAFRAVHTSISLTVTIRCENLRAGLERRYQDGLSTRRGTALVRGFSY